MAAAPGDLQLDVQGIPDSLSSCQTLFGHKNWGWERERSFLMQMPRFHPRTLAQELGDCSHNLSNTGLHYLSCLLSLKMAVTRIAPDPLK